MRVDLHIHSRYSFDGAMEPEEIVAEAIASDVEVISITDHDTMEGVRRLIAKRRRLEGRLAVVPGIEITAYDGEDERHILGYFRGLTNVSAMQGKVERAELGKEVSIRDAIEFINDNGGLSSLAHPGAYLLDEYDIKRYKGYGLKGLEVYHPNHSDTDVWYYGDIAGRVGLEVTGGSDFHGNGIGGEKVGVCRGAIIDIFLPTTWL